MARGASRGISSTYSSCIHQKGQGIRITTILGPRWQGPSLFLCVGWPASPLWWTSSLCMFSQPMLSMSVASHAKTQVGLLSFSIIYTNLDFIVITRVYNFWNKEIQSYVLIVTSCVNPIEQLHMQFAHFIVNSTI
jgi:hypothetical protein